MYHNLMKNCLVPVAHSLSNFLTLFLDKCHLEPINQTHLCKNFNICVLLIICLMLQYTFFPFNFIAMNNYHNKYIKYIFY